MDILQNNPYRILGVYSNSPTKERLANHNRMKAFLKVGKPFSFPLDLPQYLSSINRTDSMVADAAAKLTLPKDQISYSQFWFLKIMPLDEVAFNHLISGEIDKAVEIWQKRESASSLQNLIVCSLMRNDYDSAMTYAERLYGNVQYVEQLVSAIARTSGNIDSTSLAFSFLDILCEEIGANKLLPFVTDYSWKSHIGEATVKPLIDSISDAIDIAKKSKGEEPKARLDAGENLMESTKSALDELKRYIPISNIQYQTVADKLAQEILQCGIDYYNNTDDDDAPQKAMHLQKYALSIAVGALVKDRCKENVDTLTSVGPEYRVRHELTRLMNNIKELRNEDASEISFLSKLSGLGRSVSDIQRIVNLCIPDIETMKTKLGRSSDLYMKVASAVVSASVNALVEVVNFKQTFSMGDAKELRPIISSAIPLMRTIGNIDMDAKTRNYYNGNNSTLQSINSRLNPDACYIATMAYGDYNHPQVIILRHFRDWYLSERNWGKWFIKTYYRYSPRLVEKLKSHTLINKIIRMSLDGFIFCIKNKYE